MSFTLKATALWQSLRSRYPARGSEARRPKIRGGKDLFRGQRFACLRECDRRLYLIDEPHAEYLQISRS